MTTNRPSPFRAVIACGGTGGHLFPGLAVAEALHARGHEVVLFVSEKDIDTTALKARPEFRSEKLPSVGLPSLLISPAAVRFVRRFWESFSHCRRFYRKFRPSPHASTGFPHLSTNQMPSPAVPTASRQNLRPKFCSASRRRRPGSPERPAS
jgi:hypothetical protein